MRLRRTDARDVDGGSIETMRRGLASMLHDPRGPRAAVWRTAALPTRSLVDLNDAMHELAFMVVRESLRPG